MDKITYTFFDAVMVHWLGNQEKSLKTIKIMFEEYLTTDPYELFDADGSKAWLYDDMATEMFETMMDAEWVLEEGGKS